VVVAEDLLQRFLKCGPHQNGIVAVETPARDAATAS
jgi:hypothetical protein